MIQTADTYRAQAEERQQTYRTNAAYEQDAGSRCKQTGRTQTGHMQQIGRIQVVSGRADAACR